MAAPGHVDRQLPQKLAGRAFARWKNPVYEKKSRQSEKEEGAAFTGDSGLRRNGSRGLFKSWKVVAWWSGDPCGQYWWKGGPLITDRMPPPRVDW